MSPPGWPDLGGYSVIYADPPWSYSNDGSPLEGLASSHYQTMSLDDIRALPVGGIAAKDCALLMWGTWPLLADAVSVVEAWGFTYVTCPFVWVKTYQGPGATPVCGLGYYTRISTEYVLLGRRGSVPVAEKGINQVVWAPRTMHSSKPPEFVDLIDRLWPKGRRIELFARRRWPGWDAWGNQVEDAMPLYRENLDG